MKKIVLLLPLYLFTACSQLLVNNEKGLIVTYRSSGCFHLYTKIYEFKNNEVTIYNNDKKIGTTKTTKEELNRLEKLFESDYKNKQIEYNFGFNLCFTSQNIKYELYQGDKLLKSKFYCIDFEDKNIILLLYYFDKKLEQQKNVD